MAYLTPDTTPGTSTCRALFVPDDEQYLAIVRGALQMLTFPHSWVPYGTLTPTEAAENFVDMFDRFCFDQGVCRVVGEIIAYAGTTSPDARWLACDGASLVRVDYPDLFAVIGTDYGAADGSHFSLPDLRGRTPSGAGTGSGLSPVVVGDAYGEQDHQLTIAEMPAHVHDTGNSLLLATAPPPPANVLGPNPLPAVTGSTGGDGAHNNVGPRLGVTYLIVAVD